MPEDRLIQAVEKTIRYADIFNFPLKEGELRQYLVQAKAEPRFFPPGPYRKVGEYYVLQGREELVGIRKLRDRYSQKKIARAISLSHWLRIFPGVRLVGLSGSVAAFNAAKFDDIDLVIVTAKGRIWLTRTLVLLAMSILGLKRPDRSGPHFSNQFCFNLWLEDSSSGLKMKNLDLYTAYEVCLMKPLLGGETYRRFLKFNSWTERFLPNFSPDYGAQLIQDSKLTQAAGHVVQYLIEIVVLHLLGWALEPLAKFFSKRRIYGKHARHYHTDVTITSHQLMFHPESPREKILATVNSP